MGDCQNDPLRVDFDRRIKLEFHGANVTSDAGLLPYRELDDVFNLTAKTKELGFIDPRKGKNTQHQSCSALLLHMGKVGRKRGVGRGGGDSRKFSGRLSGPARADQRSMKRNAAYRGCSVL